MTRILTSNRGSLRAMVRQSMLMRKETLQFGSPFISASANQRLASQKMSVYFDLFSLTSFQARRPVQSSLWSSTGMIILALQYLQYLRFSFVPFNRTLWSNSKTVDSCGSSGKDS